jgi:hypothetical protein
VDRSGESLEAAPGGPICGLICGRGVEQRGGETKDDDGRPINWTYGEVGRIGNIFLLLKQCRCVVIFIFLWLNHV